MITAYRIARQAYVPGGVNRVILATDGDFNVGITSQSDLLRLIERERESGVFLSVFGVGSGNLKDSTMEMLADRGNGHYAYLDSIQEARRMLVREGGCDARDRGEGRQVPGGVQPGGGLGLETDRL